MQTGQIISVFTAKDIDSDGLVELFSVAPEQTVHYEVIATSVVGVHLDKRQIDFTNHCPGADHSDDNFSASSYILHLDLTALEPGVREEPTEQSVDP